jgi:hypothetical protein
VFTEIQNLTQQNQAGARCSLCKQHARIRKGQRARVFRTPLYIDHEGWVEVCEWCLEEGGLAIGMAPVEELETLREMVAGETERADAAHSDLEDARQSIRVLAQSLAVEAETNGRKVAAAYDRGYEQAEADAKLEHADAS